MENATKDDITNKEIEKKNNHIYVRKGINKEEITKSIKSYPKDPCICIPHQKSNTRKSMDSRKNHNDRHYKNNFRTKRRNETILSPSFESMREACKARVYKVHAPGCSCSKIQQVRSSIISYPSNSTYKSNTQYNKTFVVQKEKQDKCHDDQKKIDPLSNGLVVVPGIKYISHIYVSTLNHSHSAYETDETYSQITFHKNIFSYERILRDHIFPSYTTMDSASHNKAKENIDNDDDTTVKVNCATCMLHIEPNGFVCLTSTLSSLHNLQTLRDNARMEVNKVVQQGNALHADHAHYVCIISSFLLLKYMKEEHSIKWKQKQSKGQERQNFNRQTDQKDSEVKKTLSKCMMNEGIPIALRSEVDITKNTDQNNNNHERVTNIIKIQYHLKSLLMLSKNKIENQKKNPSYWFILVYDDTKQSNCKCWALDLPGGKRHLCETSWQGAVRETWEESSVMIDHSWIIDQVPHQKDRTHKNQENTYFFLKPPRQTTSNTVSPKENKHDHQNPTNQTLCSKLSDLHL